MTMQEKPIKKTYILRTVLTEQDRETLLSAFTSSQEYWSEDGCYPELAARIKRLGDTLIDAIQERVIDFDELDELDAVGTKGPGC